MMSAAPVVQPAKRRIRPGRAPHRRVRASASSASDALSAAAAHSVATKPGSRATACSARALATVSDPNIPPAAQYALDAANSSAQTAAAAAGQVEARRGLTSGGAVATTEPSVGQRGVPARRVGDLDELGDPFVAEPQ